MATQRVCLFVSLLAASEGARWERGVDESRASKKARAIVLIGPPKTATTHVQTVLAECVQLPRSRTQSPRLVERSHDASLTSACPVAAIKTS